jgi:hypothetical protein
MVFLIVPSLHRTVPHEPGTSSFIDRRPCELFTRGGEPAGDYVKERTCSIVSMIEMVSSKGIIGLSSIPSSMHRATSAAS